MAPLQTGPKFSDPEIPCGNMVPKEEKPSFQGVWMTYIMFIFLTYNEIPIPKRHICRADRCRVLCAAARTGWDGAPPSPLQHSPHPSWHLAITQAEMQDLGLRSPSLTVQGVAKNMALAARPAKSSSFSGSLDPSFFLC